jgi:hypothetical protein
VGQDGEDGLPDLMAEVNAHILSLAATLSRGDEEGVWGFRCECGAPDCDETVEMPLSAYGSAKETGEPVLAPNHSPTAAP